MARNITIDLNKWSKVDAPQKYDSLTLILKDPENGGPLPPLHFVKKNRVSLVKDPGEVIWTPNVKIDMYCEDDVYKKLVDWWYDSMLQDDETKTILNDLARNATERGMDLKNVVQSSREWLYHCIKSKRKSDVKKFITNWVSRATTQFLKYHK